MKNFFGAISGLLCAALGAAASVFGAWSAALTTLLVMWWNSLSTAKAWYFGSGPAASYDGLISRMLDVFYPIGSVYISSQPTDPGTLFGGTWTRIKDTFILAAGDTYAAGATGGEEKHTLTADEMPAHSHAIYSGYGDIVSNVSDAYRYQTWGSSDRGWKTGNLGTNSIGGGAAHNNMPPYGTRTVRGRTA